ncbi:hypothetical protein BGX30_002577 [Mortierella sp. GBA39]|nr:hypothetical protein BGX30_002577 [Mortierella sp. GBA39]
MGGSVFADSITQKVRVWMNGKEIQDGGYIIDGKTYVPIREFDGVVKFNSDTNKVEFIKPNVHIFLFNGDTVFGNVNKGKLKFNVFCQVDSLSDDVASVKVAITDPSGKVKDIQSQDVSGSQKDNFWFRTYDFTYDFSSAGKYKVGFYIKATKTSDYVLHEEFVLTLTDENGKDVEMVLVETFDVGENVYALLLERENPEADGIILRVEEEDEEMMLYNIEDEEEWNKVEAAYNELVAQLDQE